MDLATRLSDALPPGAGDRAIVDGPDGARWYGKRIADPSRGVTESLASEIARSFDRDTAPPCVYGEGRVWSREVVGRPFRLSDAGRFLDGFVVDVLLANRDACGMGYDNLVVADDRPVRIDGGGALLFRALGKRKAVADLARLTEWEGFADPAVNPEYARVFVAAGLRPDDFRSRLGVVAERAGTWNAFVAPRAAAMPPVDREATIAMLEVRTRALALLR